MSNESTESNETPAESPPATTKEVERILAVKLNTDLTALRMTVEALYNLLPNVGFTKDTFIELGDAANSGPREMKYLSPGLRKALYTLVADFEDARIEVLRALTQPQPEAPPVAPTEVIPPNGRP